MATARRIQDSRKVRNDTQEEIATIKQWVNAVRREKGLLIVEIYTEWAGPCDPMVRYMKRAKYDLPEEQQETVKCYVLAGQDVAAFEPKIAKCRPIYLFFVAKGRLVDVHPPIGAPPVVNPISMGKQIRKWADLASRYELGTLDGASSRSPKDNLDFYFPLLKDDAVLSMYKPSVEDVYLAEEAVNVKQAEQQAAAAARAENNDEEEEGELGEEEAEQTVKDLDDMRRESAIRAAAANDTTAPLLGVTASRVENFGGNVTDAKINTLAPDAQLAQPVLSDATQPVMGEANVVGGSIFPMVAPEAGMQQQVPAGVTAGILGSAMAETNQNEQSMQKQAHQQQSLYQTPADVDEPSLREVVPGMDDQQLEQAPEHATPTDPHAFDPATATTGPPDGRGELFHPTQLIRPNEPVNPAAQAADATMGDDKLETPHKTSNNEQAEKEDAEQWVTDDFDHSNARAELAVQLAVQLANPVIGSPVFEPNNLLAQQIMHAKQNDAADGVGNEQALAGFSHVDSTRLKASIEQDAHGFYADLVGNQAPPRTTFTMNEEARLQVNQPEAGRPTFGEKFVEELVTGQSAKDDAGATDFGLKSAANVDNKFDSAKLSPLPPNIARQLTPEEVLEVATEVDEAINRALGSIDVI